MRSLNGATPDDQRAVIAFLTHPSSYGPGIERAERIETHISLIFLAGNLAYKLKRAVKLPYLDFFGRRAAPRCLCRRIGAKRRTVPSLYLKLRRIGRAANGKIDFVEDRPALDWVVVMRRFDQASSFDALAQKGELDGPLMDALSDHIAQFHAAAEQRPDQGGAAALAAAAETNHQVLTEIASDIFPAEHVIALLARWRQALSAATSIIEARRTEGKVRRCHGDLHLRNICLVDGKPVLFDCLEFSESLASIDILYDLAFLLMDLEYRRLPDLANRVLNRYLDRTAGDDGLAAMPLFLSLRAGIRAHVTATALANAADRDRKSKMAEKARRYLDLALEFLEPQPRRLIAIGGLSGSGKSTVAAALAPELGLRPGARVLRSDVIRKLTLGAAPETRLPAEAYTPEITRQVYDTLQTRARAALDAGYMAIIDAVSLMPEERQVFAEVASQAGVPFTGLWLEAEPEVMSGRIGERRGDATDATAAVLSAQLRQDPGLIDWIRIDASGGRDQCVAAGRRALAAA